MKRGNRLIVVASLFAMIIASGQTPAHGADPSGLPSYLRDRGDGIPTSLFGTYIREKEFVVYPFYEYTRSRNFEYDPRELGFALEGEFFGKAVEREALIFLAYAFSDSLMVELESALYSSVDFTKAPNDPSNVPNRIRESGLGDTEMQLRWRYAKETATRPEVTFFFKTVFPLQRNRKLLGTQEWEFSPGVVLTKGFSFGTLALRLSAAYDTGERKLEFSEYAIDYVKQLSPKWRLALSLEGEQDEVQAIGELQYRLSRNATLKMNIGTGITKKAPNFAPEIGVLFRF